MSKQLFDIDAFRAQPLRTEDEIMASWQGYIDKPVVSVLCNTFNQATYIEDAFRGFLIQKTDFVFEVIVHDDASTDGTTDIVKEYAKRYPKIFKPVIQTENQYSQGKKPTLLSSAYAKGIYYALCEGDDFWADENKLQLQYYTLIESNNVKICFTKAFSLEGKQVRKFTANHGDSVETFDVRSIIINGGQFMPTASLFLHSSIFKNLPNWFLTAPVGDYYLQVISSAYNGAIFLPVPSCVYRVRALGSWTLKKLEHNIEKKEIISKYNERELHLGHMNDYFRKTYKGEVEVIKGKYLMEAIKEIIKKRDYDRELFSLLDSVDISTLNTKNKIVYFYSLLYRFFRWKL